MSNQPRIMTPMKVAAALAALLCAASAAHATTYVVTQLTTGLNGQTRDISPSGVVCGVDLGRAFVWKPSGPNAVTGTLTMLPSLIPNFSSDAYSVNSAGFVVGRTGDDPLVQHEVPVIWRPDGSITKLPLFNGVSSGGLATGINETGQITGRNGLFTTDAGPVSWNVDGTGAFIGNPPNSADSWGWKLNAGGAIAGTAERTDGGDQAFIHAGGQFTFLPSLPGATLSGAYDINDVGHVVGSCTPDAFSSYFFDGTATHGLANVPGDLIRVSTAQGLNNHDQIVGFANPSPNRTGGVIWDNPAANPQYLSRLIDPSSPGYVSAADPGWIITEAVAINDLGQIAARGVSTHGGSYRALLLTPAPQGIAGADGAAVRFALDAGPSPSHGAVSIQFTLPFAAPARVRVFDIAGRAVATLHDGPAVAGTTRVSWAGAADDGRRVAPGLYLILLDTPDRSLSRRLVIAK